MQMATLSWSALPGEVLAAIARLLLGVDLLRLARVDHRSRRVLSRAELFAPRLSHVHYQRADELKATPSDSQQQIYMQASSLSFSGQSESQGLPRNFSPVFWSTDALLRGSACRYFRQVSSQAESCWACRTKSVATLGANGPSSTARSCTWTPRGTCTAR
jgi:hypothetical protein